MKVLSVSLLALASIVGVSSVQAQESSDPVRFKIVEARSGWIDSVAMKFLFDDISGDAAIEYTTYKSGVSRGEGTTSEPTLVEIPGLSYNPETKQVTYTDGSREAVCAVVTEKKGQYKVKKTGACTLEPVLTTKTVGGDAGVPREQSPRRFRNSFQSESQPAKQKDYDVYYLTITF